MSLRPLAHQTFRWTKWIPGEEYTKQILLRNVGADVLKIKYGLPASEYFALDFPESIKLSPGMSTTISVTFRPARDQPYEDTVPFRTQLGDFEVTLLGGMPLAALTIPDESDFGFAACFERSTKTLRMVATGRAPVKFHWQVPAPYAIYPPSGHLQTGEEANFTVAFTPPSASVFTSTALCVMEDGPTLVMKLRGIGKFAFVQPHVEQLSFGHLLPGTSTTQTITFTNQSPVDTALTLVAEGAEEGATNPNPNPNPNSNSPSTTAASSPFTVTPSVIRIAAGGKATASVTYAPLQPDVETSTTLTFHAAGGNASTVAVSGSCMAPRVSISTTTALESSTTTEAEHAETDSSPKGTSAAAVPPPGPLTFGNVPVGRVVHRTFKITNHSRLEVPFQVLVGAGGTFTATPTGGRLIPHGAQTISVTYVPQHAGHFYRRLMVLVQHISAPIAVDLIATAFSPTTHPDPLLPHHVRAARWGTGGGLDGDGDGQIIDGKRKSPTPATSSPKEQALSFLPDGSQVLGVVPRSSPKRKASSFTVAPPATWEDVFNLGSRTEDGALTLSTSVLDFGACSRLRASSHRDIVVTNHSSKRLSLFWSTPRATVISAAGGESGDDHTTTTTTDLTAGSDATLANPNPVFTVFPDTADLGPGLDMTFRVAFRPAADDTVYEGALDLVAMERRALTSSLHTGQARVPSELAEMDIPVPWTLSATASGHTRPPTRVEAAPLMELSEATVTFPPGYAGSTSSHVVALTNVGSTPVAFRAQTAPHAPGDGGDLVMSEESTTTTSFAGLPAGFEVLPAAGTVPPGGVQLLAVRSRLKHSGAGSGVLTVTANGGNTVVAATTLRATCYEPEVDLVGGTHMFMKPTCVGATSTAHTSLSNPTGVPVAFAFAGDGHGDDDSNNENSSAEPSGVFTPSPRSGLIPAFSQLVITWSFTPRRVGRVAADIPLRIGERLRDVLDPSPHHHLSGSDPSVAGTLRLEGESLAGGVTLASNASTDLGVICVGDTYGHVVPVRNMGGGAVTFDVIVSRLFEDQNGNGGGEVDDEEEAQATGVSYPSSSTSPFGEGLCCRVKVEQRRITLPGLLEESLHFAFTPRVRRKYAYQVQLLVPRGATSSSSSSSSSSPEELELLSFVLRGEGQHPTMQIVDVGGSTHQQLPKPMVWSTVAAATINAQLALPISSGDIKHVDDVAAGRVSVASLLARREPISMHLPVIAAGADPERGKAYVRVVLHNPTDLPTTYHFVRPGATDLDEENWVAPHYPPDTSSDLFHLFTLEPNVGTIAPGASCEVTISFTPHAVPSTITMPMLLYLDHGPALHLHLTGRSVDIFRHEEMTMMMTPNGSAGSLASFGDVTHDLHAVPVGLDPGVAGRRTRSTGTKAETEMDLGDMHADPRLAAPIQSVVLYNVGLRDVEMDIDISPLEELAEHCWGVPVLTYVGHEGDSEQGGHPGDAEMQPIVVPAGGEMVTFWRFAPVQVR